MQSPFRIAAPWSFHRLCDFDDADIGAYRSRASHAYVSLCRSYGIRFAHASLALRTAKRKQRQQS
jgi:hypothetical protein